MEQYTQRASNEDNSIKLNVTLYIRHLPTLPHLCVLPGEDKVLLERIRYSWSV